MVLVSILMTSYNHEKYLTEAIESVLNQSFRDFELIIVDDASTDSSPKVIEEYARKDKRIRPFYHKSNMGISKTANDCLAEAKGKFVAFIASDDAWVKTKLERQLAKLEADESLIVWSEGEIIDENGIPSEETFTYRAGACSKKKSGNIFKELFFGNFILGQSIILKREFVKGTRFDEHLKYLNDYKFMVDLAHNHRFFFIEEPLTKYRVHEKSTFSARKSAFGDLVLLDQYLLRKYGNEVPKSAKIHLLFSIGWGYSQLNEDQMARFFFLEAVKTIPSPSTCLRCLIYFLTTGKGYVGHFLLNSFTTINSLLMKLPRTRASVWSITRNSHGLANPFEEE
jgi:glycosyltransferase involved in cell wall biosynthesis